MSDAKIEVKPTAKMWEPLRAYEKRLVSILHKGTSSVCVCVRRWLVGCSRMPWRRGTIGAGGKGRRAKGGALGTSDEESGPEAEGRGQVVGGEEGEDEVPVRVTRARARPRPRGVVRRPPTPTLEEREVHGSDVEMDAEVQETPRSRPRVRVDDVEEGDGEGSPVKTPRPRPSMGTAPRSSLKRQRDADDDDDAETEGEGEGEGEAGASADDDRHSAHLDEVSEDAETTQPSPTSEFIIRRKRARH